MTIDLQTLKCGECGSSVLKRTGLNEYTCEHCGSVTLVEDNVSDRLERVLNQVKNEAEDGALDQMHYDTTEQDMLEGAQLQLALAECLRRDGLAGWLGAAQDKKKTENAS